MCVRARVGEIVSGFVMYDGFFAAFLIYLFAAFIFWHIKVKKIIIFTIEYIKFTSLDFIHFFN